jgi:8-oxo-dGTP pyrophosphatase MutT (NUDIX family)
MMEKSCGTVPYSIKDGVIHYLLVRTKGGNNCSFPKGHVEQGESEIETAIRETFEETSLKVNINRGFRRQIILNLNNGNKKTVVFFPASFDGQTPKRNGDFEDYDYLILPFDEAYSALTFENVKRVLRDTNDFLTKNT